MCNCVVVEVNARPWRVKRYTLTTYFLLQAHKNSQNMTEIEAKVSYVKLARSLKTYGVSFFLVKVNPSRAPTLAGVLCCVPIPVLP